jgi:Uma2 family endonuclease
MVIVKTHIHGTPDLICEVLSHSTRERDLGEKADRYLKNGVKEYWIIDPDQKSTEVWQNNGMKWEKFKGDSLKSFLIKDFIVQKEEIF